MGDGQSFKITERPTWRRTDSVSRAGTRVTQVRHLEYNMQEGTHSQGTVRDCLSVAPSGAASAQPRTPAVC